MKTIGLMSGTSMDGIDAALISTDGKTEIKGLGNTYIKYQDQFKILLKAAEYAVRKCKGNLEDARKYYPLAIKHYLKNELKMQDINIPEKIRECSIYIKGTDKSDSEVTFDEVIQHSTHLHAKAVLSLLDKTGNKPEQIDIIGYHGQTLFHNPAAKITIQIGDGQMLADQVGISVVNDFRSLDVRNGGQGAPLAPVFHQALAVAANKIPLRVVNCGGISNSTLIIGPSENDIIGFDSGPGNGLIDQCVKERTHGKECMDKDGQYGKQGKIHEDILADLYCHAINKNGVNYFELPSPKSLDIGDMQSIPALDTLSLNDACATLEAFTAETIVRSLDLTNIKAPTCWVLAGGGWNNPVIVDELRKRLIKKIGNDFELKTADEMGWNSQAMEAQIFGYLAVRSLLNLPISFPNTTRVSTPLSGGHAYVPQKVQPTTTVAELLINNPDVLTGYKDVIVASKMTC